MTTLPRPIQRVGHIAYDENRFCGTAVFGELAARVTSPFDLIAYGFGLRDLSAADREILRCIAVCLTSPDARVWPLKMTRTLAAYGNPYAGFFGAQLANQNELIGPGTTSNAAASLAWIAARVGDDDAPEAVAAAVATHVAERGRLAGFGVPFRKDDERLLALRKMLADHPATRRPAWRLHLRVVDALRAAHGLEPNIVVAMAALLLDLGLAPHRAGMFVTMIMAHTFSAHALEAAEQDGPYLRELPRAAIDDQSPPLRRTPAAAAAHAAAHTPPGSRAALGAAGFGPRRSLAW